MTVKQSIMVLIIAVSALAGPTIITCARLNNHIAEHESKAKYRFKTIPAVRPVSAETEKKYNDALKDSLQDLNAINASLDRMLKRAQQERDSTRALLDLLLIERARVNKVPK